VRPFYSPWRKRLGLVRAYFFRKPVWWAWQVTYRCNFRCSICPYWKIKVNPQDETPPKDFRVGAEKLARWGSLMINLAGGEPLLRRDLCQIISTLARYHIVFTTTNGWLVTRKLACDLYEAGLWGASVSIDYVDPQRHDERCGVKGAFERAVNALRFLSQERTSRHQRVNLMCVLNNDNLEDVEGLIRLADRLDANFMLQPYSDLKTGDKAFLPSGPVSARLLELKKKYPNFISNASFLANFDRALSQGVPGCLAGRAFFNIDNYSRVSMCVEDRRQPVGNLIDNELEELLQALRKRKERNTCQACWYNCRGEVEVLYSLKGALRALPPLVSNP